MSHFEAESPSGHSPSVGQKLSRPS